MSLNIRMSDGGLNRFEVLDKKDVLRKLTYSQNSYLHTDIHTYKRISKEILITARSTAKLFVYDNKTCYSVAINHTTYNLLYYLLDQCTKMDLMNKR